LKELKEKEVFNKLDEYILLLISELLVALAGLGRSRTIKIAKNIGILNNILLYLCISTTLEKHYLVFILVIYMASLFGKKGKVDRLNFFVILEYASQLRVNKDIKTHILHRYVYHRYIYKYI